MVRRMTPSQFKTKLRQVQSKQKQAINKHNREVNQYNQKVKQVVNKYNQDVRAHNARVRSNNQRLKYEFNKLSRSNTKKYTVYYKSVVTLKNTYSVLDQRSEIGNIDESYNYFLDLSEKETANSMEVLNSLLNSDGQNPRYTQLDSTISNELELISDDLDSKWRGALFSLNPNNPDASRHFCASSRELITQILKIKAPDNDVVRLIPDCFRTKDNKPTRKAKIKYLLLMKGLEDSDFEKFVDEDMQNVLDLFQIFNDGTHGSAGKFSFHQLSSIKKRVEDSLVFLSQLAN